MDKLVVIILNYKSYKDTVRLIQSIDEYETGVGIIVVDNASGDEERSRLSELKDRCELVLLDENSGYAAGNNAGIRKAIDLGYETFLIANSDTYLISEHTISNCYDYMKKNGIAILGPRMTDESGSDISGYVYDTRFGRTKRYLTDKITECRSLVGAFIFIDKSVIDRIGFMKEFYFLFLEETDYCVRAFNNGFKIVFYPKETIVHKSSATTKGIADYYTNRNKFIFAREIYKTSEIKLVVFHFFRSILFSIKVMMSGDRIYEIYRRLGLVWKAYFDGVWDIRGKLTYK